MSEQNPRYPHKLKILRVHRRNGDIVYDADGNVTYDYVRVGMVAMCNGWMVTDSNGSPVVEKTVTVVPCGYRTNTRNAQTAGDVIIKGVTLHCPPFVGEVMYDDILEITDYDRTYKAKCVKKVTFNGGTAIWFDELGN